MLPKLPEPEVLRFECIARTVEELEALGREFSLLAGTGMIVLLSGELGSGKSTFARSFIRSLANDPELDVPSPTFNLLQTYSETRFSVAHLDFYRLNSAAEAAELGLDELLHSHLMIVEWPERATIPESKGTLAIHIQADGKGRKLLIEARGDWSSALQRNSQIREFLAAKSFGDCKREFLEGDASFRRYETLRNESKSFILMDMPARPDGPPVKNGKPYSALAHLAENITAVVAVNAELVGRGYSAPITHAYDLGRGLAVIEDLGRDVFGRKLLRGDDMREPMKVAVDVLVSMAGQEWPADVFVEPGIRHHVDPYDLDAQLIETELLTSWYWPYQKGDQISAGHRDAFTKLWSEALLSIDRQKTVWTLRDFHSPNLLWLPDRTGVRRVGLIDTQDSVRGHPAYDLASLLQDARVDLPEGMEEELLDYYCSQRGKDPKFDAREFRRAYAVLGAQRATKILGIFVRLFVRDGKNQYLKHLPRVERYLRSNLAHHSLIDMRKWFESHLTFDSIRAMQ